MGSSKGGEINDNMKNNKNNNNKEDEEGKKSKEKLGGKLEKSYFEVLGLCCSSEVPLIEKIVKPLEGVVQVSVIVPSRTLIVLHDPLLISDQQIVKALNQARLEASVRVNGKANYRGKWPSPYVFGSGILLALSFLKYVYHPLEWLALAAVVVGIWPILMRGVIALKNITLDVNILMLIAVVGTIVLRDYTEAGTIVFLFTIAEWLESRASHKATAVMSSLMSMAPQTATIAETGEVVNVEDVKLNTIVAVKAGEIIPIDGVVVDGTCEVDEKTLTGESFPVAKQTGSTVWAGTVNVNGYVSVQTTALAEDCAVAKLARLVEEAQNNKSNVQRLIDKCAKYYTPAVVLISAGLAVAPIALKLHDPRRWFRLALVVLVSACPCGLILSTPVATFCALSRAATSGLLIKGGDYLELLAKIKTVAFDKTGTVTRGEFTLMDFEALADNLSLTTLLYWVSSIEAKSSHPIASVLIDYAQSQSISPKPENVEDFQNFPGEGVFGRIDGREIYIGNKKIAQMANYTSAPNLGVDAKEGRTSGYVYSGGALIGTFSLSDNCRSGAKDAIEELKSMGIRTALLTGDSKSAATHAQEQLEHALDVVRAELLPQDKARIIEEYKLEGPTAMVGDGVNDAPALATADVGISMGVSGSALATETGHVVLMSNDIRKIPEAVKLARRTQWKVIQNIVISIGTKAGVMGAAFAGHPLVWLAVLVDVFTCLLVILNSMLLLRSGHQGRGRKCLGLMMFHGGCCHSHSQECCSDNHHHHGHHHHHHHHSEHEVRNPEASKCCSQKMSCSDNHAVHTNDHHHHHHRSEHESKNPEGSDCCSDSSGHANHHHHRSEHESTNPEASDCCSATVSQECCSDKPCQKNPEAELVKCCSLETEGGQNAENREPTVHGCNVQETDASVHHEIKEVTHNHNHDHSHVHNHDHHHHHHHDHNHNHDHHDHHHHHHHHNHDHDHRVKQVCGGLRKRAPGACCKSYRKECCSGSQHGAGVVSLTEIVTE